ncbi:MAG: hypothetical protein IPG22_06870 [Acidobacteria bacterium]|nr:hypothetical protein [Acidobacteriota bacterium]
MSKDIEVRGYRKAVSQFLGFFKPDDRSHVVPGRVHYPADGEMIFDLDLRI